MIKDILKVTFKNFQQFLVIWIIAIIVNQLFIFGACFAVYCLVAALPHTGIISLLLNYFICKNRDEEKEKSPRSISINKSQIKDEELNADDFEETKTPFCSKCGSKMVLRTARKGKFAGENFWGCSRFPECKGITKS